MIAKYINQTTLQYPTESERRHITLDGRVYVNPSGGKLKQLGYADVREDLPPEDIPDGKTIVPTYEDCGTYIQTHWAVIDVPPDVPAVTPPAIQTTDERITALEDQTELTAAALEEVIFTMMEG